MINLKANTCPTREDRGNGINSFFGKASELTKQMREGGLQNKERSFQQSSGCLLNFFLTQRIMTIRDSVMIVHGPVGCSVVGLGYREIFRKVPVGLGRPENYDFHWLTTNLQERDAIYGAGDKLKQAVRDAQERYDPQAIFVLASCTSGIIGEDIEGIVSEVQPEVKAKIVPIHCEGIKSKLVQTGYDAFWHGVLKYLVKKPAKKQKDLVNVASMLSYTWQDRMEITRLLGKLGLRPNFIPEFATVEQFEILSEAAVTAPICSSFTDYLSRGLEQEYGVLYFLYPSPIGVEHTDEWLKNIAYYTGKEKEVKKLIAEEHDTWLPKLEIIRNEFEKLEKDGKKIDVLGSLGQGRMLTQVPFFNEIGVKTSAAICLDFDNLVVDETDKLIEEVGDFDILVNTFQASEVAHHTRRYDPDIALTCPFQGNAYKREKGATRIHSARGDAREWSAQAGYKGAIASGNFLLQSTRNRSFQQTMLEKTPDVYNEWWYNQPDPLYFTKEV
ncbi:oxidoreductase/nitrogenase component 1 [Syntrophobotulus glycolicus DSM 8271]|uniref:Oxidoreductase/nitrogenase component 1 n=1 Tax=Syntrophobotulus glycolicus (strain DSM 8271 / FlGlyR) TaxID=645991 RepID=F0SXY8_SYNGF|nr:nitrogenase component 1 [Syntrophobotulus glycolicus]ADY57049.1 oxidoreductase/nitrogenase component 1 [Syntrophobotulus glycolicus DSM 8271]